MFAKIYCMASPKGGSGKTVLTATFCTFLSGIGKKALMIDLDIATHGLTLLYLKEVNKNAQNVISEHKKPKGLFDRNSNEQQVNIFSIGSGIDLLPATYDFQVETQIEPVEFKSKLRQLLSKLRESYDFIFLDAQAGSDDCAKVAISSDISDEVLIVTEYDPLSSAGVERMKGLLRNDLTFVRTWVLINKMLPEFIETFSDFLEVVRYLSPIPWDSNVVRSYSRRKLAIDMEFGNEFTLSIIQTLKVLLGEGIAKEINLWAEDRASTIRQPIEEQYLDAEKELKGLLEQKIYFEKIRIKKRLYQAVVYIIPVIFMISLALSTDLFGMFKELFDSLPSRIITSTVTMLLAIGGTAVVFLTSKSSEVERDIEESKFNRQLKIIEEKLEHLEVLKKADLNTLIKSKK